MQLCLSDLLVSGSNEKSNSRLLMAENYQKELTTTLVAFLLVTEVMIDLIISGLEDN